VILLPTGVTVETLLVVDDSEEVVVWLLLIVVDGGTLVVTVVRILLVVVVGVMMAIVVVEDTVFTVPTEKGSEMWLFDLSGSVTMPVGSTLHIIVCDPLVAVQAYGIVTVTGLPVGPA
jgi:hypothetical protein